MADTVDCMNRNTSHKRSASDAGQRPSFPGDRIPVAPRWRAWAVLRCAILFALFTGSGFHSHCQAQTPEDLKNSGAIQRAITARSQRSEGVPLGAFMVLDERGNLQYLPAMTYERWRELESGTNSGDQAFVFEPLEITGTASDGRAVLDLKLAVTIEPTDGRYVSIPLKMKNFFLLHAPKFSSKPAAEDNDEDGQFIQPSQDGMVLKVRSSKRRKLIAQMTVSARVESGPNRLDFQLPSLPTNIQLDLERSNVEGEIIGSGSEVLQTKKRKERGTRFNIASGGGSMTLQWSPAVSSAATASLIESNSVMLLNWGSPDDQPIASVTMSLRSLRELRGPIESFELQLPAGSVLLDTPTLNTQDQPVGITPIQGKANAFRVTIPEQERSQRVAIDLQLQLSNEEASEQSPMQLQVPKVIGALRQQGEIQIQTSSNYRLRWRSSSWVRSFLADAASENLSTRTYQFRFDRGDVTLPIWLSANRRQLLANSESLITVRENVASLEMEIQFSGRAADSRSLELDLYGWRLQAVLDSDTDDTLPWFESKQRVSIEMNTNAESLPPIKIFAQQIIQKNASETTVEPTNQANAISFQLPRVVRDDKSLAMGSSGVLLQSIGRSTFVINMEESTGLERAALQSDDEQSGLAASRFRVFDTDTMARVVGTMVQQPPQISLTSQAELVLSGDQLTATMDWSVTPQMDLAGELAVRVPLPQRMPESASEKSAELGGSTRSDSADSIDVEESVPNPLFASIGELPESEVDAAVDEFDLENPKSFPAAWSATVDGVAADLISEGGNRFRLISDRLSMEPVVIRWRRQELVPMSDLDNDIRSIGLPVPAVADLTVRGNVVVSTQGDSVTDLLAADTASQTKIEFQSIPDRVRVRFAKRSADQNELSIRKAVLRTAVGSSSRYEQFLALIQGGDALDVGLPTDLGDIAVEARVDQVPTTVSRAGDRLRLTLPGDRETHRIDLRIWVNEPSDEMSETIRPVMQLPLRIGRVYWQVVTPKDSHIVWAAPTIGRAMDWQFGFDSWSLSRKPVYSDVELIRWVDVAGAGELPPGNRYLYIGSDIRSFSTYALSRAMLWLLVGGFLLAFTWMLWYAPASRNPLTAVAGAVLFAGLVALAPDAAVLAGQLSVVAFVLVLVMLAIASLLRKPTSGDFFTPPVVAASAASVAQTRSEKQSTPSTRTMQVDDKNESPMVDVPATGAASGVSK